MCAACPSLLIQGSPKFDYDVGLCQVHLDSHLSLKAVVTALTDYNTGLGG